MRNIAVIGTGISGLAAAYLLSRRHRVHLFEKEHRLGGHTNTVIVSTPEVERTSATLAKQPPVAFSWLRDRKV